MLVFLLFTFTCHPFLSTALFNAFHFWRVRSPRHSYSELKHETSLQLGKHLQPQTNKRPFSRNFEFLENVNFFDLNVVNGWLRMAGCVHALWYTWKVKVKEVFQIMQNKRTEIKPLTNRTHCRPASTTQ